MFFAKLLPREGNFFQLFEEHAAFVLQAAKAFTQLVTHYDDEILRDKYIDEVNKAEHAADRITREVHRQLHATFITPIDREQILQFIDQDEAVIWHFHPFVGVIYFCPAVNCDFWNIAIVNITLFFFGFFFYVAYSKERFSLSR